MTVKEIEVKELENEVSQYKPFEVVTSEDYEKAAQVLKSAKSMLKVVDEKEKEVTRPLNEGLKKARALFKPFKEQLNGVVSKISGNMFAFRKIQEEEARKKQEELDRQKSPDDIFTPEVEVAIPKTEVRVRTNWRFKVIDKSKLKPDFLIPDERSIGEFVRKFKNQASKWIGEGAVEIYKEETSY